MSTKGYEPGKYDQVRIEVAKDLFLYWVKQNELNREGWGLAEISYDSVVYADSLITSLKGSDEHAHNRNQTKNKR